MQKTQRRRGSAQGAPAWTAGLLATTAVATAVGMLPAPALAQQTAAVTAGAGQNLVSLDLRSARFEDAVFALTQQVGVSNVVFQKTQGKDFGTVTLKMEDQPFDKVLRAVAASAQATVTFEDGIYYLRPAGAEAPAPAPKVAEPAPVAPVVKEPVRRGPRQWVKIPLQYVMPSEFTQMLDDPTQAAFMKGDPQKTVSMKDNVYNLPTQQPQPAYPLQVAPNASVGGNAAPAAPVAPAGGEQQSDSAGQRGGRGQGGFGGGFQGPGGAGGGGGFQGGPGGGGPGGQGGNTSLRPDGIDQIISNDSDNALLVVGDAQGIEELRNLVRLLDVAPKQVLIRAEFVSVSLQDADQFGVDWRIQPAGNLDVRLPGTGGPTPTVTLAYASGNAVANLRATLTRSSSNLLQAPIVSTTNNRRAQIFVMDIQPSFQTIQTVTNVGIVTQTVTVPVQATNGLDVTPHINGDNSISLALSPQLQSVSIVNGPAGNIGIRQQTQGLTTYRRVQNGETMVLGGFITKAESRDEVRVPLLSDLPIIGNLFTQRNRSVNGTEILVFVTPTIIEDRAQGVIGTGGSSPAPTP